MAWLTQWWTLLATLAVVFVPGLVAAWSLGFRRLAAWAFAPVGSIAMISLVATVFGFARIPWTLLSAALGLVVVAGLLVGCRFLFRIRAQRADARGARWPVVVALVVAAVLLTLRFSLYIGEPDAVSQSNDAPFHLGAVRAIIEHANASSFGLAGLVDPAAAGGFYPGAWHATASLAALLSGAAVPVATNMLSIVVAAAVWPAGVAWLTVVATRRRVAGAVAAALSPVLLAFPLLLIQYGILYSYMLAVALVPAAVAAVIALSRSRDHRRAARGLALLMALGALGASQPAALLAWALPLVIVGVGAAVLRWRGPATARRRRIAATALAAGAVLVLGALWAVTSRLVTADYWGPVQSLRAAALDVASSGYAGTQPAWWMSALAVIGLVVVLMGRGPWTRMRWLAWWFVALVGLYVVAAAVHSSWIRLPLVGPWYSDTYRLAALLPAAAVPLAAIGLVGLVDAATRALQRRRSDASASASGAADAAIVSGIALTVAVVAATAAFVVQPVVQRVHVANGVHEERSPFAAAADSWLDSDERALLSRLSDDVAPGARVIANPGTGAAFAYALTGVDVYPAKWQVPTGADYLLLAERLHDAAQDPEVCAAVDALGVGYVLDFGLKDTGTGRVEMPGFTDLDGVPGFELVDSEGEAKLWRITACA